MMMVRAIFRYSEIAGELMDVLFGESIFLSGGKMHFSDEVYRAKAVEHGIVSSTDAISSFKRGHLSGLDAIKIVFSLRLQQIPTMVQNPGKQVFMNTMEKLNAGEYDGKLLESLIQESSRFLGDRYTLWKNIMITNTNSRVLSKDELYTLPQFSRRDVDPYDSRYVMYDEVFLSIDRGEAAMPRTRKEVIQVLHSAGPGKIFHTYSDEVDTIISYLVRKNLI